MKKAQEFRDQSADELEAKHEELRKQHFKLKNERRVTKKLEKPHLVGQTKREIACLLTILTEKRSQAAKK